MNNRLKAHEKRIKEAMNDKNTDFNWLLDYHKTWIAFMQHERLIHLIVTMTVAIILVMAFGITVMGDSGTYLLYAIALDGILVILFGFYIVHYYQLENGVQRWYRLYDEILVHCRGKGEKHE